MIGTDLSAEYTPSPEIYRLFIGDVPRLVEHARYAAKNQATSWRDFKVGAAVFAIQEPSEIPILISARGDDDPEGVAGLAGNQKPKEYRSTKCAEPIALRQAEKRGANRAIGLTVAGSNNRREIQEVAFVDGYTLPPCQPCSSHFVENPLMRDDTLIVAAGLELPVYQVYTNAELRQLYLDGAEVFPKPDHGLGFNNWSMRVEHFDRTFQEELAKPMEERRSIANLAQVALTTPVPVG